MSRVIHFEIPADDPERASRFYGKVFGWSFTKWDCPQEYWMVRTGSDGPGIDGGMARRKDVSGTTNVVGVESVDATIASVEKAGGKLAVPKCPVPGVGWVAYFLDTEGTFFGVMQFDQNAK